MSLFYLFRAISLRMCHCRAGFIWFLLPTALFSDVIPSALFQDHAVLQRDKPIPIWGTAEPGEQITILFSGQSIDTRADAAGRWLATLQPLGASSTPATLTIRGKNTVMLSDIVVGEVWLASGQSNMEWNVQYMNDADLERITARLSLIRELRVKRIASDKPSNTFQGQWRQATAENLSGFSAVAYSFAKDVQLALNVPVGIINSSWGGTSIESWMSADTLTANPDFAVVQERWAKILAEYPVKKALFDKELAEWNAAKIAAEARGQTFTLAKPRSPNGPGSRYAPSALYNSMISPLLPCALRGVIWYQGESNAGRAHEYPGLFAALIQGWRSDFAQGDFPFFWVQLEAFKTDAPEGTEWAAMREAQASALSLPATGQAITIDNRVSDYGDVHFRNKLPVGRRLARLALAKAYGIVGIRASGPVFDGMAPVDGKPGVLRVSFKDGDKLRCPARELAGFEVAGKDRQFYLAAAQLDKDGSVLVSSPRVASPVAVRYAWRNYPNVSLEDDLGLPVAPFRSDAW